MKTIDGGQMMCYEVKVNANDYGAGERTFVFSSLEDASEAVELLIWLDPEPCISSTTEAV